MIDLLADTSATLRYFKDNLKLRLGTGPYITGSFLLYHLEQQYRTPNWFPKDIDIICKTAEQFEMIESFLVPLTSAVTEEPSETDGFRYLDCHFENQECYITVDVMPLPNFPGTIRTPGEYTINTFYSDGEQITCDLRAHEDIKNQILRLREPELWLPGTARPKAHRRYQKYKRRGYQDPDLKVEAVIKHALGLE